tara:strand:+ start:57883 stop:58239 length:357 start_codon:yes stop_codon:yes gene_type:complete
MTEVVATVAEEQEVQIDYDLNAFPAVVIEDGLIGTTLRADANVKMAPVLLTDITGSQRCTLEYHSQLFGITMRTITAYTISGESGLYVKLSDLGSELQTKGDGMFYATFPVPESSKEA